MKYATMLAQRLEQHSSQVWLVNTGWTGGRCGAGWPGCNWSTALAAVVGQAGKQYSAAIMLLLHSLKQLLATCACCLPAHCRHWLPLCLPHVCCCLLPKLLSRRYGVGRRMDLEHTRAIVNAIHSGEFG